MLYTYLFFFKQFDIVAIPINLPSSAGCLLPKTKNKLEEWQYDNSSLILVYRYLIH